MKHGDLQRQVSLFVDNALNDRQCAQLFAHLAKCKECRAFLSALKQVRAHLGEEALAEVPESLDRRVHASIAEEQVVRRQRSRFAPYWFGRVSIPLPAAASILFLIVVGTLLLSPLLMEQREQPTVPIEMISRIPASLRPPL